MESNFHSIILQFRVKNLFEEMKLAYRINDLKRVDYLMLKILEIEYEIKQLQR